MYYNKNDVIIQSDLELNFEKVSSADIETDFEGNMYKKGCIPKISNERIAEKRKCYRQKNLDDLTLRRNRKKAMQTWSELEENNYLEQVSIIEAQLNQTLPYTN